MGRGPLDEPAGSAELEHERRCGRSVEEDAVDRVLSLSVLQEILAILASPDYVSSLITGGLLVIVTIVWAPDFSQWFRTTRLTGSLEADRASS